MENIKNNYILILYKKIKKAIDILLDSSLSMNYEKQKTDLKTKIAIERKR